MYEENCSKTLLLSFFIFRKKTVLSIIFFFLNLLWKQNYLRPGLTVYKQISFLNFFADTYIFGVMFNGNLKSVSVFKPCSFAHL